MPCMSGLPGSYRPGLGYGQAGRLREGRQLARPVRGLVADPRRVAGAAVRPLGQRPALQQRQPHAVRAPPRAGSAGTPRRAPGRRPARGARAAGRRRSARRATPACGWAAAAAAPWRARWCTAAARPARCARARAYSRAIIDQSKTALCATSTRPASRSANSSAMSGKSGAPSRTSLGQPVDPDRARVALRVDQRVPVVLDLAAGVQPVDGGGDYPVVPGEPGGLHVDDRVSLRVRGRPRRSLRSWRSSSMVTENTGRD